MLPKYEDDTFVDCLALESLLWREVLSEWKRNVTDVYIQFRGKTVQDWRHPVWKPLCTYKRLVIRGKVRSNFDLHYVNPGMSSGGVSDVAFYVMKYMMKPSDRAIKLQQALHLNLDEDEYLDVWSKVRPRHFESEALGFGTSEQDLPEFFENGIGVSSRRRYVVHPKILSYLRKGIEGSKHLFGEPMPCLPSTVDGKFRPLANYYKSRPEVYTMGDFLDFFYASKKSRADNVVIDDPDHPSQVVKKIDDFARKVKDVSFQQTAYELDDLFDEFDEDFIEIPDIPVFERETRRNVLEARLASRYSRRYHAPLCFPFRDGEA